MRRRRLEGRGREVRRAARSTMRDQSGEIGLGGAHISGYVFLGGYDQKTGFHPGSGPSRDLVR